MKIKEEQKVAKKEKLNDAFWSVVLGLIASAEFYPISNAIASKVADAPSNKERILLITEASIVVLGTGLVYKFLDNAEKSRDNKKYKDDQDNKIKDNYKKSKY